MNQKQNERSQMITSITKNIEELAKNHYWLLANHSSVLAGLLETYLREREVVQLELHSSREAMKNKLKFIEDKYADDAFYYYSRLIKAIYDFQWVTGNTYFLKDYWSGEMLTKLYNHLQSVMEGIDANKIIDVIDRTDSSADR